MDKKKTQEVEDEVKETTAEEKEAEVSVEKEKTAEEERVKIKLFKDNKDYKDDLTVGVNGKLYIIKRGIEVEVPKSVAEVIENSIKQDQETADMIESLVNETEQKERENGI